MVPSGRRREKATSQGKTATTARRRMGEGCDVQLLLFETFGGCGKGVLHLLRPAGRGGPKSLVARSLRPDVMVSAQLEDVPDTAAVSVVLARAAAAEIMDELKNAAAWAVDPADRKAA